MITFRQAIDNVQRKLDDEAGEIWTRQQVSEFLNDAYDNICREAKCLFEMAMYTNAPRAGNYTKPFETQFMTDMPILGQFNFTKESEREFMPPGAVGPANHTKTEDATVMTTSGEGPTTRTVGVLPDNLVEVDRVTHNWLRLKAEPSRYLRQTRNTYETLQGGVYSYSMDQDGLNTFRTVGVPVTVIPNVDISGVRGVIRFVDEYELDSETVIGGPFGIIRSIPREFESGFYGGLKNITTDDNNTRIEYFKLGKEMTEQDVFEVPDRVVRYVEWWAMYRAYAMPGEGEDKILAEHFKNRYSEGVNRLKARVNAVMKERTPIMGMAREGRRDGYLEHFPADYGRTRRFGG